MANITVKKADGTTNITYVMKTGATATSPATFRNETASAIRAMQPQVLMNVTAGSSAATRRADISGGYPGSNGVDLTVSTGKTSFRLNFYTSDKVVSTDTAEGVHQMCNLIGSPEFKQAIIDGFGIRT